MIEVLGWIATVATIGGALLTASNLGAKVTGSGFVVFLFGSLSWLGLAWMTGQQALMWTNIVLTFLNLFGIWRWLGRQARVEEGGKMASEASAHSPGETLFPVSLLGTAPVFASGEEVGACVDAMAGQSSGRLAYVMISQGGLAGIGEHFRRLAWSDARVDGKRLVLGMNGDQFRALPEVAKDEWPAR